MPDVFAGSGSLDWVGCSFAVGACDILAVMVGELGIDVLVGRGRAGERMCAKVRWFCQKLRVGEMVAVM